MKHGRNTLKWHVLVTLSLRSFAQIQTDLRKYQVISWRKRANGIIVSLAGESVPLDEQTTNAKDNRNSQVFESLALLAPSQPAVSDKERKKFEDEKSKLYIQLDEKVSWKTLRWCGRKNTPVAYFHRRNESLKLFLTDFTDSSLTMV